MHTHLASVSVYPDIQTAGRSLPKYIRPSLISPSNDPPTIISWAILIKINHDDKGNYIYNDNTNNNKIIVILIITITIIFFIV